MMTLASNTENGMNTKCENGTETDYWIQEKEMTTFCEN